MYYVIEISYGDKIKLFEVENNILHELIENISNNKHMKAFYMHNNILIEKKNINTLYFKSKEQRDNMLIKVINSRHIKALDYLKNGKE